MVNLARRPPARFAPRAKVKLTNGEVRLDTARSSIDRFVSTYALYLLSEEDIQRLVCEARYVLVPHGLILLAGLTNGGSVLARLLEAFWGLVFSIRPSIVGGCRPISLQEFLPRSEWLVHY